MAAEFNLTIVANAAPALRAIKAITMSLDTLEGRANRTNKLLSDAFKFTFFSLLAHEIAVFSDELVDLQNRLRLVAANEDEVADVTQRLFEIANRTRISIEGTGVIYSRVALAARELGVSQAELLRFTESLNKAIILSGSNSKEAAAAMIQFSQGIASGALRGDELRSVLEQLPYVADIIAKQLGITRGEMREFGKTGGITAEVILDAFENIREEIDEKFSRTIPTISQSFTVLRNQIIRFVGDTNKATGAAQALSVTILALANNIDVLAKSLFVAGAALVGMKLGQVITAVSTFVQGQAAVLSILGKTNNALLLVNKSSNQFAIDNYVAAESALFVANAAKGQARGLLNLNAPFNVAVGRAYAYQEASKAATQASIAFEAASKGVTKTLDQNQGFLLKLAQTHPVLALAIGRSTAAIKGFFTALLAHPLLAVAAAVTALITVLFVFADKIKLVEGSTATLSDFFKEFGKILKEDLGGAVEALITGPLSDFADWFTKTFPGAVKVFKTVKEALTTDIQGIIMFFAKLLDVILAIPKAIAVFIGALSTNFGNVLKDVFISGLNQLLTDVENLLNSAIRKYNESDFREKLNLRELPEFELPEFENSAKGAADQFVKVFNETMFAELFGKNSFTFMVGKAFSNAITSAHQRVLDDMARASEAAAAKIAGFFDPILDKLREEEKILKLVNTEREIQSEMLKIIQDAKKEDIDLTSQQGKAYLATVEAQLRTNQVAKAQGAILDEVRGKTAEHAIFVKALSDEQFRATLTAEELALAQKFVDEKLGKVDDTLEKYLRDLDRQLQLSKMSTQQAKVQQAIWEAMGDSQDELDQQTKDYIETTVRAIEANERYKQTYESIVDPIREAQLQIQVLNGIMNESTGVVYTLAERMRNDLIAQLHRMDGTALGGLKAGFIELQLEISDFASQSADLVKDAFSGMKDALLDLVFTGKAQFKDLFLSILRGLADLALNKIFATIFGNVLTGGGSTFFTQIPTLFGSSPGAFNLAPTSSTDQSNQSVVIPELPQPQASFPLPAQPQIMPTEPINSLQLFSIMSSMETGFAALTNEVSRFSIPEPVVIPEREGTEDKFLIEKRGLFDSIITQLDSTLVRLNETALKEPVQPSFAPPVPVRGVSNSILSPIHITQHNTFSGSPSGGSGANSAEFKKATNQLEEMTRAAIKETVLNELETHTRPGGFLNQMRQI